MGNEVNPSAPEFNTYIEKAARLAQSGNLGEAEAILKETVNRFPKSADAWSHLGYFYYKTGRYSRAFEAFSHRLQFKEPDYGLCRLLAEMSAARGEHTAQRKWLQKARKLGDLDRRLLRHIIVIRNKEIVSNFLKPLWFLSHPFHSLILLLKRIAAWKTWILIRALERAAPGWIAPEKGSSRFRLSEFLRFTMRFDPSYPRILFTYHKNREAMIASRALPTDRSGVKLLDIGTGKNPLPLYWSTRGPSITALDGSLYGFADLNEALVKIGQRGIKSDVTFAAGDGLKLPFKSNQFDGVSALCALEHIPGNGDIECMREIYRVTKPGGRAVVTVESGPCLSESWMETPYEIGYQTGADSKSAQPKPAIQWHEVFCRNYSPQDMIQRLGESAPWRIVEYGFYDDGFLPCRRWLDPLKHPIGCHLPQMIQPLLALLFFRPAANSKRLTPSSVGYLVLERPLDDEDSDIAI